MLRGGVLYALIASKAAPAPVKVPPPAQPAPWVRQTPQLIPPKNAGVVKAWGGTASTYSGPPPQLALAAGDSSVISPGAILPPTLSHSYFPYHQLIMLSHYLCFLIS